MIEDDPRAIALDVRFDDVGGRDGLDRKRHFAFNVTGRVDFPVSVLRGVPQKNAPPPGGPRVAMAVVNGADRGDVATYWVPSVEALEKEFAAAPSRAPEDETRWLALAHWLAHSAVCAPHAGGAFAGDPREAPAAAVDAACAALKHAYEPLFAKLPRGRLASALKGSSPEEKALAFARAALEGRWLALRAGPWPWSFDEARGAHILYERFVDGKKRSLPGRVVATRAEEPPPASAPTVASFFAKKRRTEAI